MSRSLLLHPTVQLPSSRIIYPQHSSSLTFCLHENTFYLLISFLFVAFFEKPLICSTDHPSSRCGNQTGSVAKPGSQGCSRVGLVPKVKNVSSLYTWSSSNSLTLKRWKNVGLRGWSCKECFLSPAVWVHAINPLLFSENPAPVPSNCFQVTQEVIESRIRLSSDIWLSVRDTSDHITKSWCDVKKRHEGNERSEKPVASMLWCRARRDLCP